MTGVYVKHVELVSYGNEAITSGALMQVKNDDIIRFLIGKIKSGKVLAANSQNAWFKWLLDNGCVKLELGFAPADLSYLPEYQIVGHGEPGVWYIKAIYEDHCDYWVSKWKVAQLGTAQNGTVWNITYRKIDLDTSNECEYSFDEVKKEFVLAIDGVKKFAKEIDGHIWIKKFDEAVNELDKEYSILEKYNENMVVRKNYSLEAMQVITAAAKAWVFGGMGNWSDNYYPNWKEHHRVTKVLFDAVCKALICGVNSFPS